MIRSLIILLFIIIDSKSLFSVEGLIVKAVRFRTNTYTIVYDHSDRAIIYH